MKRMISLLVVCILCLSLLVACGCKHAWEEANCATPKMCPQCGETVGDALGHSWSDATCETPKTCRVCGLSDGNALGHKSSAATCAEAEICSVCNQTLNPALGHTWQDATCITPKTCTVCAVTEGELAEHSWQDATCLAPQTCSVCAETTGDLSDHAWVTATCTDPKTCSICGKTTGSANGHKFEKATCTEPKTCSVCSVTEGDALGHTPSDTKAEVVSVEDKTVKYIKTCKECGVTLENNTVTLSQSSFKEYYIDACSKIGYKDLLRNPGTYKGDYIKLTGTVFQVVSESSSSFYYSVYFVKSSGNLYCVYIDNYNSGSRILKGDKLTIYGTVGDLFTYETIRGDSNTIPTIYVEYY